MNTTCSRDDDEQRPGRKRHLDQVERHHGHHQEQRQADARDQVGGAVVDSGCGRTARRLRIATPTHHAPEEGRQRDRRRPRTCAASHCPATTAAKMPASAPITPTVVIGVRRLRVSAALRRAGLRAQLVSRDQVLRHRAGDDAADDQPDGGHRHRQLHHRLQVVDLGEALGVGGAGAVAADQRDRARHQAEDRVQVERLRGGDADRVLHQDVGEQHQQEDRQRLAALA